ncbi:MAG: hypothetical protein A3J48_02845 [Candidatus Doudnabacteria bacterium RIFCSPHIGHO2_02_FULL_46_11]|uniref:DUF805 domain-containing protein n=1 Tax=Candidatus Doudnabacteria bacterium RIFCSPHIGHO2_02_FULL_46_11 TaxID=1817832 RepID=A0A1F5P520_9BACT|nr:MAG: hypothetical protein A3J48_02845 [Candidatus Doudnabacteria bacterium RIFCSPHIGHO2_02_FULL_46_11]
MTISKLFSIKGRATRKKYFFSAAFLLSAFSLLLLFTIYLFILGIGTAFGGRRIANDMEIFLWVIGVFLFLLFILALILYILFSVRRLHDMNLNGYKGLWLLVPIANIFFGLYLLFTPGTQGSNKYDT